MIDVAALGECLIDFTPNGENAQGIALFARNPGGAPANVLAMNARPSQLMVSLGVSAKMSVEALQEFYEGVRLACEELNIDLARQLRRFSAADAARQRN